MNPEFIGSSANTFHIPSRKPKYHSSIITEDAYIKKHSEAVNDQQKPLIRVRKEVSLRPSKLGQHTHSRALLWNLKATRNALICRWKKYLCSNIL